MNKKELIESIAHLPSDCSRPRPMIDKLTALELIKLLDEPQKPVVPQFVADYIEKYKEELSVREAISKSYATFEVDKWLAELDEDGNFINQNTFALAWIIGYTVEKEKRYYIRLKNVDENYNFLNYIKHLNAWALTEIKTDKKFRSHHTRKELEDAGFGEVFNSPLFEVEEVE